MADTNDNSFDNIPVTPPAQPAPITETDITPTTPVDTSLAPQQPQPVQEEQQVQQQAPQPTEEELQRIEANKPTWSTVDLEAQAYIDLDDAKDYKSGVQQLIKTYSSAKYDDPEKAKEILANYSEHMRHRFKEQSLDVPDLVQVLPVKPEEVQGETDLETVNAWEQANLKAIQESTNPGVIAMSKRLIYDTQRTASNIRREQIAGSRGEGMVPWVKDKFFRVAEGAISPFAKIINAQSTVDYLRERTQPSRDETLASTIAGVGGAVIPMVAASVATGGAGPLALAATGGVIAGQAAGEMAGAYRESIQATGDPSRAAAAAGLTGAAQAVGMLPIARIGNKVVKSYAQKLVAESVKEAARKNAANMTVEQTIAEGVAMAKTTYGQWAVDTLSAGAGGAAATALGNIGVNVGQDLDIPITQGMRNMVIAGAFIGGTTGAFHAAIRNASIDILREQYEALKKPGADQTKPADGQPDFVTDEKGNTVKAEKASDKATTEGDTVKTKYYEINTKTKTFKPVEPDPTEGRNETVEQRHERELKEQRLFKEEQDTAAAKHDANDDAEWIEQARGKTDEQLEVKAAKSKDETKQTRSDTAVESGVKPQPEHVRPPITEQDVATAVRDSGVILTNTAGNERAHLGLMSYIRNLGSGLRTLMNVSQTAFGETEIYSQNVGGTRQGAHGVRTVVNILRSLGAKPEKLRQTLAHELGHVIEEYIKATRSGRKVLNQKLEDITESMSPAVKQELDKLADFYQLTANEITHSLNSNDAFYSAAARISSIWRRTTWNGTDYNAYRSQPTEIFADLVSNWINHPEDFSNPSGPHADAYRLVGAEMRKAMEATPKLHELNTHIQRAINDSDYSYRLFSDMKKEGAQQQAKIMAEEKAKYDDYNSLGATTHRWLKSTSEMIFNKFGEALKVVRKAEGTLRNVVYDIYNDLTRYGTVHNWIDYNYRKPITHLVNQMIQDGIHPNQLDTYLFLKRILEEKTVPMDNIEHDFPRYLEAAKVLRDMMRADPRIQKSLIEQDFNIDNITTPKQLSDAFAKVNLITDVAEVFKMEEVAKTVPHEENMTPEQKEQWENRFKAKYNRLVASLAKRKESIPMEDLRAKIEELPSEPTEPGYVNEATREALRDVLQPGAFNARRYLINMDGTDVYDAPRLLDSLKASVEAESPGKYAKIEEHAQKFHDIMSKGYDILAKSGLFSPEMMHRFYLNKDNYVTNKVIAYFEGSNSYEPVVRQAIGSFKVVGDELSSTFGQMNALVSRAYMQRSVNAAIHLANIGGTSVEKLGGARPGYDIFAQKAKLSKSDREHSYLIEYNDGKPTLWKIEGKSWENMFKDIRTMPVVSMFLDVSDKLNKLLLTRQFKTVLSPTFVLMQKFYDRKLEAIMANSYEFTFGMHTAGFLRKIDAQTKAEIKHWQKTGELTGNLKTLVDLDGAMLSMIKRTIEGGTDDGMPFEHTLYESFGAEIPHEKGLLERVSIGGEKLINRLYGDKLTAIAEFDELRTKLNGFRIGKHLGMGDAEAAIFAREKFGVPDPVGGGIAAPMINRAFLFGRAHLNGLRVLAGLIHDTPMKAAGQIAYRIALPKALMFGSIMGPAIASVFGDETGEVYKMGIDMIPEYDKMAKNCILYGFQDGQGNYHNFTDVKKSDIQADWKAWYARLPQSREMTSITRVLWPLIKGALEMDVEKTVKGTSEGIASVVSGNIQPVMQYMSNIVAIAQGKNPQDFFRNKPIFSKEMEMGGTLPQKAVAYGKYLAASHYPTAFPYNPFRTVDANNKAESLLNTAPVVGPFMRSFSGVSNYGMIEKEADATNKIRQIDASIKLRTGDDTQQLFGMYASAASTISKVTDWKEKVGPDVVNTVHTLTAWHSKIWIPYRNELRAALEKGDSERFDELVQDLETSSSTMLKQAHQLASALQKVEGSDKSRRN